MVVKKLVYVPLYTNDPQLLNMDFGVAQESFSKSLFLKSRVASRHGSPSGVETGMEGIMAWTEATRANDRRAHDHRQNDVSDAEWALIAPLIPEQGRMGRPRRTDLRRVFDAIQYMLASGCQWRLTVDAEGSPTAATAAPSCAMP